MRSFGHAAWLCAGLFTAHTVLVFADTPSVPSELRRARLAPWPDPLSRCPELRQADLADASAAVVAFRVGPTGVPSRATIKTSSRSPELDSAAVACVMTLKFLPATAAGDGGAIESWQQMAWKSAMHSAASPAPAAPAAAGAAAVAAPAATAAATAGAAAGASVAAASHTAAPVGRSASTEVRVCADANGKLTQEPAVSRSSGDAAFDAAALEVARSGSGHYRPGVSSSGQPAPGCLTLSIRASGT